MLLPGSGGRGTWFLLCSVPNWVSANISAGDRASGFLFLHVSNVLK